MVVGERTCFEEVIEGDSMKGRKGFKVEKLSRYLVPNGEGDDAEGTSI